MKLNKIVNQQNKKKIKSILSDPNIIIWYRANRKLIDMMISNKHPMVISLPKSMKQVLMEGKGIAVSYNIVLKYLEDILDESNSFIFDNGEIFVTVKNRDVVTGVTKQIIKLQDLQDREN